ncbi:type 2 lanthipeptide synthetase LanM family protein [Nostoc sp. CCY0012]|uniref:type 2 lanthipeptide synthetase LanM family protein n=1 Tax=Nostoc sp. CCY0012 TaxID=1056123 RepID=UPI0039C693B0
MNQSNFHVSTWYQATTLTERLTSLHTAKSKPLNKDINTNLAEKRVQVWKSQSPFTNDIYFAQRLAIDGMTEEEFKYLLGEPVENVQNRFSNPPTWLTELEQAFSRSTSSNIYVVPPSNLQPGTEATGFLYVVEPLISQGFDRLYEGVSKLLQNFSDLPFDPNTIANILFTNTPRQLLWIMNRTMILELHVARLQGILKGNTPEDRFRSFLQYLWNRQTALDLLQEYPVLARHITICIDQWVKFSLEFLQHLCADWADICTKFHPQSDPGHLVAIEGDVGDSHRGGRSVLIARFSSGFRVVYKPRSLAIDQHFQELLAWINQRSNSTSFRTLKIIDRGSYGWVEFVIAHSCSSSEEIQNFYQRQGGYLALLYALEGTDFHFENLIAAGDQPILVDLECLFHPEIGKFNISPTEVSTARSFDRSVLQTGLLPIRMWADGEYEGADFSGLGSTEGQLSPHRISHLEGKGTDEMRVVRDRIEMSGAKNQPTLNGKPVNVLEYTHDITSGFTDIYRLLQEHRDELLSENGLLMRFAEDEVRVLLRSTQTYGLVLDESFHPDLLRNALDRDRLLDHLWVDVKHRPFLAQVISAEREDLQKGSIPLFTTRPSSRDLWSSSNEQISNFFNQSGLDLVRHHLQHLSDQDLEQQLWFIRASLATLAMASEQVQWSTHRLSEPKSIVDSKQLLATAQAIGERLEILALKGQNDATWLGLTLVNERHWSLTSLGMDLYDGLPGIILFLAYLGAITQEQRYTSLAHAALTRLLQYVERNKSSIKSIGGFGGWGGVIYALTHLGVLWNQTELLIQAESLVNLIPTLIEQDEQLDIIGGSAGCIVSLLTLYHCQPSPCVLAAAIQCGNHLLTKAQNMEQGVGWVAKGITTTPLSGFSHGVAGIAWSLLELSALTGEERFRKTALEAIAYERSLFCPQVHNWLDLRSFTDVVLKNKSTQPNCVIAWCHGAPGIGLSRLRSLPHLDFTDEILAETNTALKTTLAKGFGYNHSLCHGDLGNLELLLQASQTLDDPQWKTHVDRFAAIILESIDKDGCLCGVPLEVETPGLMTGLAGIGYQLLRLAEPDRVPSVLVLEPPKLNSLVKQAAENAISI